MDYFRQVRRGGDVMWLHEVVDNEVTCCSGGPGRIALVVDETRRPYIAYFNPGTGELKYATVIEEE